MVATGTSIHQNVHQRDRTHLDPEGTRRNGEPTDRFKIDSWHLRGTPSDTGLFDFGSVGRGFESLQGCSVPDSNMGSTRRTNISSLAKYGNPYGNANRLMRVLAYLRRPKPALALGIVVKTFQIHSIDSVDRILAMQQRRETCAIPSQGATDNSGGLQQVQRKGADGVRFLYLCVGLIRALRSDGAV
jgi:hypothetical protein